MNYRRASNYKIIDSAIKILEIWARSLGNMPIASIQLLSSVPLLKPVNLTTPVAVMLRITADVMHGVTSAGPVSGKVLQMSAPWLMPLFMGAHTVKAKAVRQPTSIMILQASG